MSPLEMTPSPDSPARRTVMSSRIKTFPQINAPGEPARPSPAVLRFTAVLLGADYRSSERRRREAQDFRSRRSRPYRRGVAVETVNPPLAPGREDRKSVV